MKRLTKRQIYSFNLGEKYYQYLTSLIETLKSELENYLVSQGDSTEILVEYTFPHLNTDSTKKEVAEEYGVTLITDGDEDRDTIILKCKKRAIKLDAPLTELIVNQWRVFLLEEGEVHFETLDEPFIPKQLFGRKVLTTCKKWLANQEVTEDERYFEKIKR